MKPPMSKERFDAAVEACNRLLEVMQEAEVPPDALACLMASSTFILSDPKQRMTREAWLTAAAFVYERTIEATELAEAAARGGVS